MTPKLIRSLCGVLAEPQPDHVTVPLQPAGRLCTSHGGTPPLMVWSSLGSLSESSVPTAAGLIRYRANKTRPGSSAPELWGICTKFNNVYDQGPVQAGRPRGRGLHYSTRRCYGRQHATLHGWPSAVCRGGDGMERNKRRPGGEGSGLNVLPCRGLLSEIHRPLCGVFHESC